MLSIETLHEVAPSVFATGPSPKMSSKYTFVPTIEVVENFDREGWKVFSLQSKSFFASKQLLLKYLEDHEEVKN